jgi:hypothetical protein
MVSDDISGSGFGHQECEEKALVLLYEEGLLALNTLRLDFILGMLKSEFAGQIENRPY